MDLAYEMHLQPLYTCLTSSTISLCLREQLRALERMTLLETALPSARQQARMWFLSGQINQAIAQSSLAFESYELCERQIGQLEGTALLILHSVWAPLAQDLRYAAQAYASYGIIIELLAKHLRTTDNETCVEVELQKFYAFAITQHEALIGKLVGDFA